jgi:chorismate-pyruvate lyase
MDARGSETTAGPNGLSTQDPEPSRRAAVILESALLSVSGTVTAFLEEITGEALEADRVERSTAYATVLNDLNVGAGHPLAWRKAILRGRSSARAYLYAESLIVPDRLPQGICARLETTTLPIGRVLAERGFQMTRTVLGAPDRTPTIAWLGPDDSASAVIYARRYRVDSCGMPVMLIAEWFLQDLRDAILVPT